MDPEAMAPYKRALTAHERGESGAELPIRREDGLEMADDIYAVSYLAASGYTLTVVLDFRDGSLVGFASGADEWYPGRGTLEVVE